MPESAPEQGRTRVTDAQRPPGRSLGLTHYIFAAVLLVRLYALVRLTGSPFLLPSRGDMHFYNEWAQRIVDGQLTDHLAFYGLPLYAYLLAFFYKVFGYGPFVPGLLQALLEAGTATLLFQIARRVFDEAPGSAPRLRMVLLDRGVIIGVMAAAGWAFFVPAQAYSVILMPTAWLIFVFWFLVWQIVKTGAAPGAGRCVALGLLIGVTAMGIATILFTLPLLVAAILLRPRVAPASSLPPGAGASWKLALSGKFGALALLFLGVGIGTSPAWLHNRFLAHDPVFLSAHSGVNFWIGNNPGANGYPRIPPGLRAGQSAMLQDSITVAEATAGRALKRSEVSAFWSAKAKSYIGAHPGEWLQLVALKLRNFWNAFQYDDLSIITSLREEGVILPGPRFGLVAALALPGMLLAVVTLPRSRWIVAAVLLHMMSLLTVFVTERYRLAAVPGLLLFGAFALVTLWQLCATARYGPAAALAATIAVATLFVSLPQRDPALWALDAYNSGWQALESDRLAAAEQKLRLAYAYMPGNAEVNFALGNLHYARGERAAARNFYLRTVKLEPRHERSFNNLGVLALEEDRRDAAIGLFETSLAIAPNNAKSHYLLARALFENGQRDRALIEVEIALELHRDQPEFTALRDLILRSAPR